MIVITGCAGYIGRHLAQVLRAQGQVVRGVDRNAAGLRALVDLGVEPVVADVGDLAALRAAVAGGEVVFHLAGSALGHAQAIVRANVEGAHHIAAACAAAGTVRRLIFAGSGALYPSGPGWLDEATPPAPAFGYARAKAMAEQVLLEAHRHDGLPVLVARIAGVYGPGAPALMLEMVRRGRFPLIGGGRGIATYIHIDDCVAGLMALAERGNSGQVYNLADDEPVEVRAFYGRLAELLCAPPLPHIAPSAARLLVGLVNMAAQLRGRPAPLPADLVDMAAVSHRMSNRRMREELAVTPHFASYREGLPTCIEGYSQMRVSAR